MVNCTAAERQDLTGVVYGDYMDGIEAEVFIDSTDMSEVNFIKRRIGSFSAPIIV
jgi:hypothetical protein